MINGDISNESSPRIIVVVDVIANSEIKEIRKLMRSESQRVFTGLNNLALSHLWNLSNKYGLSVEMAGFESEDWTQDMLDKIMDKLENRGGNPFNYANLYDSIDELVGELPYRNNLKGIIDLKERVARYGSYGVELANL